jgi:hypothetical protein
LLNSLGLYIIAFSLILLREGLPIGLLYNFTISAAHYGIAFGGSVDNSCPGSVFGEWPKFDRISCIKSHQDRLGGATDPADVNTACVVVAVLVDVAEARSKRCDRVWPCLDVSVYFQPHQARKSVTAVKGTVT